MRRTILFALLVVILTGVGLWAYAAQRSDGQDPAADSDAGQQQNESEEESATQDEHPPTAFAFDLPKKSAHYVSNIPEHEAVLSGTPAEVSITFDFDLSAQSTISVMKEGKEVSTGNARVSPDKLALTKAIDSSAGSGLYTVIYNACWPDGSCHDGRFQFGVQE